MDKVCDKKECDYLKRDINNNCSVMQEISLCNRLTLTAKQAESSSSSSDGLEGLVDLLRDAITLMDEGGNEVPEGSTALWDDDWQALRDKIFKAYEILNQKAD